MKKKRSIFMALLLSLVTLMMAVAPTMAASDSVSDQPEHAIRDGLALVAPLAARTNQPVTMTVFQRSDATPVEGAGIWAFTREQADIFESQATAMRENGALESADTDWEALVSVYGSFLGRTDARGELTQAFSESGWYLLVTVKHGYIPGRSGIIIGTAPNALALRAPERAQEGEPVSMTVYQRDTSEPVQGAGIWALTRAQAEAFKAEIDAMKAAGENFSAETDWDSLLCRPSAIMGHERGH